MGLFVFALFAIAQMEAECRRFGADQLPAGRPFSAPLPGGLDARLTVSAGGWQIAVGPRDTRNADYLAPVSPPYRSPLHLRLGPGYGLTAVDSLQIARRELRFALNAHDAQRARDIASAALVGDMHRWKDLDRLIAGTLTLRITDWLADDDAVQWISFSAEACVPSR